MTLEIMVSGTWLVADANNELAANVDRNLRAGIAAGTHHALIAYESHSMLWRMAV